MNVSRIWIFVENVLSIFYLYSTVLILLSNTIWLKTWSNIAKFRFLLYLQSTIRSNIRERSACWFLITGREGIHAWVRCDHRIQVPWLSIPVQSSSGKFVSGQYPWVRNFSYPNLSANVAPTGNAWFRSRKEYLGFASFGYVATQVWPTNREYQNRRRSLRELAAECQYRGLYSNPSVVCLPRTTGWEYWSNRIRLDLNRPVCEKLVPQSSFRSVQQRMWKRYQLFSHRIGS
jgi:hypothetical protein